MANTDEQVWSLGGTLLENQSLSSFFDVTGSTVVTEPGLLYDNLSGEWFATAVDSSNNTLLFATSLTSDPLGPWMQYFVPAYPNERPNQPSLGASEWMVGIAANDVNETTQNLDGTGYILLNRTDLKTGELAYYEVNPEYRDPNGRAENALTPSAVQWFGGMENPPRSAFWIGWADAPPALPSEENGYAAVSGFSPSPAASQPGTLDLLNTSDGGDARVTSAFWQNDLETLTFSTGTGYPTGESCLGLVQLWTNNSTLRQDLLVTSASDDLFYPAASADAEGDLTVVAGFSSTVTYPSAYIFGQAANEPGSLAAGSFVAVNGTASVTTDCNSAAVCDYGFSFGAAVGTQLLHGLDGERVPDERLVLVDVDPRGRDAGSIDLGGGRSVPDRCGPAVESDRDRVRGDQPPRRLRLDRTATRMLEPRFSHARVRSHGAGELLGHRRCERHLPAVHLGDDLVARLPAAGRVDSTGESRGSRRGSAAHVRYRRRRSEPSPTTTTGRDSRPPNALTRHRRRSLASSPARGTSP